MRLEALWNVARSGRVGALRSLTGVMTEFTRACFLGSAAEAGVLAALAAGPQPLEALEARLGTEGGGAPLAAWLDVGVSLGELRLGAEGYSLGSALARALAAPEHDALLAMLEEVTSLHQRLVREAPGLLRAGRRLALADQDGAVVARSSRLLEPFVEAAVAAVVPRRGPFHVLEVGCGSGTYLRRMAERNRELRALGLELQPEVVEQARANLAAWGVGERVAVRAGDVRQQTFDERFDLVTLHNNIYYFVVEERVALLRRLRELLVPGGRLLVTTATRGKTAPVAVLNLWGHLTTGCGPLPTAAELLEQLGAAGFAERRATNLAAPVERFHAFVARA